MSESLPPDGWPRTWPPGWYVNWVAETGSTNADLLAAGVAGAPDRTVLAAGHQTAGRGRLERRWEAPAGANLLVSLLLRNVPQFAHELTQRIALAALDACRLVANLNVSLKWPNDLLVDGAKLAGVLAQAGSSPEGDFVVVGIGVNVGWAPPDAARLGDSVSAGQLLAAILTSYDALPAAITPLYRKHLATIGQHVRVDLPGDRSVTGRATDVETDGRLVVLDDCAMTHRIDTGDVIHLRPV